MLANEKHPGRRFHPDRINPILSETLFRRYIVPELFKIFHVRDVHVRTVLLRHFHRYVRMFDEASLSETIFPQVWTQEIILGTHTHHSTAYSSGGRIPGELQAEPASARVPQNL